MNKKHSIILKSLLITILIFSTGAILNHFFDFYRINEINSVMRDHELDADAYRVERLFTEVFDEEACDIMTARFFGLKEEIKKVGTDLGTYSRFSIFRKTDYDALKREYILLQLKFYALLKQLNTDCGQPYLPILFFYTIDEDESERQGFILEDLANSYKNQVVILAIDKDYKDEPLVPLLVEHYGIDRTPAMVVNDEVTFGLHYVGQINSTVQQFLRRPDPYSQDINFQMTPEAADISFEKIIEELEKVKQSNASDFAKGDSELIIGRLLNDSARICGSLTYFDRINSTNHEELALVYETSAALGCGRNKNAFLMEAAKEWKKAGNNYRSQILEQLSKGKRVQLQFDQKATDVNETVITGYKTPILPNIENTNAKQLTLGKTQIILDENSKLIAQDDRVYRDWLSGQIQNPYGPKILSTFSERFTLDEKELHPEIGWHEGGRIKELMYLNLTLEPAVGTLSAKHKDKWYAVDEKGIFRFEIPIDKISYPTTRFLRRDIAIVMDTHGINMLVEQAIRKNATAVIGCCDHPGKIYAASYLNANNISVICYPDKYAYLSLGHNITLLPSPPTTFYENSAVIGNRTINITINEPIIAVNSTDTAYALWYYQTPASYFSELSKAIPLNITYVTLDEFEQMNRATQAARDKKSHIIATRVFDKNDYEIIKQWLDEDKKNKAILFHSAPYPYGQKIFREYQNQTSFGDINPVFT
jgi:hypothetical protein